MRSDWTHCRVVPLADMLTRPNPAQYLAGDGEGPRQVLCRADAPALVCPDCGVPMELTWKRRGQSGNDPRYRCPACRWSVWLEWNFISRTGCTMQWLPYWPTPPRQLCVGPRGQWYHDVAREELRRRAAALRQWRTALLPASAAAAVSAAAAERGDSWDD